MKTQSLQDRVNKTLYPFNSNFRQHPDGSLHYLDEGQGEVLLFSHGTPEWSFSYRHLIKDLSKNYRCIALDHLGFGLSDKPTRADYTTQAHAARFSWFIDQLGLTNFTIIAHDFGISIALSYAIRHPENINQIIIANGWMWSLKEEPYYARASKIAQGFIGKFLYKWLNFPVTVLLAHAFADKSKLTPEIKQHYALPFGTPAHRNATYACAKELYQAGDWWESLWQNRGRLANKPFLIFWGLQDKLVRTQELAKWESGLQNYTVIPLDNCGHFPHEEQPEKMVTAIQAFLSKHQEKQNY